MPRVAAWARSSGVRSTNIPARPREGAAMKVFLTGASGFLGAHVLSRLHAEGHSVGALLRRPIKPWRLARGIATTTLIEGDLAEPDSYRNALANFAPQAVIHLAWWGVNNRDRDDQRQVDNLSATVALLKQAASSGARHFIGLGSQAEYGP